MSCIKTKIIAVDFDGTLFEEKNFPSAGRPIVGVIEYILNEQINGAKIILWTCRAGEALERAVEMCKDVGIVFDAINENLPEVIECFGSDSRKIFAHEYIDDKAVLVNYDSAPWWVREGVLH